MSRNQDETTHGARDDAPEPDTGQENDLPEHLPTIVMSLADAPPTAWSYRIAGLRLVTDLECPQLRPLAIGSAPALLLAEPPRTPAGDFPVRRSTGLVGGALRTVTCRPDPEGLRIEVAEVGEFTVAPDGSAVTGRTRGADEDAFPEAALGPALIVALALRDILCLHAGAVRLAGAAVAFLGDSTAGKSTLARLLAASDGCERLADDVLPVASTPRGLDALPHFPQLKLPPEEQYPAAQPECVPLAAAYVLDEGPDVEIEPLGPRDAMLALMRQTVATRVFPPRLLARHTELCARAVASLPVRRLSYPRRLDVGPEVAERIRHDLG